jgi:GrpB-like predicted nucleotidyltransferase (UPF0157 family)
MIHVFRAVLAFNDILSVAMSQQLIQLLPYDPDWPNLFVREEQRIRNLLGNEALAIEHVGSTAVPGLAAKPIIDILLVVEDSSNESSYVPVLVDQGYFLKVREPEWYQHRMLKGPDTPVNLHVFSRGCVEIDRMLKFRDWLRVNESDRKLYEATKIKLAMHNWNTKQEYADAKTTVVEDILTRV